MTSRQQRRAKSRGPDRSARNRHPLFLISTITLLLAGGIGVAYLAKNPPPITRGARDGDHWHATYSVEVCGQRWAPFPQSQGGVHSHGDPQIHLHPVAGTDPEGDGANLGLFLGNVGWTATEDETGRFLSRFESQPGDGTRFADGDECPGIPGKQKLEVFDNGEPYKGNPAELIPHNGDTIIIRFGPEVPKDATPVPVPGTPTGTAFPGGPEGPPGGFSFPPEGGAPPPGAPPPGGPPPQPPE